MSARASTPKFPTDHAGFEAVCRGFPSLGSQQLCDAGASPLHFVGNVVGISSQLGEVPHANSTDLNVSGLLASFLKPAFIRGKGAHKPKQWGYCFRAKDIKVTSTIDQCMWVFKGEPCEGNLNSFLAVVFFNLINKAVQTDNPDQNHCQLTFGSICNRKAAKLIFYVYFLLGFVVLPSRNNYSDEYTNYRTNGLDRGGLILSHILPHPIPDRRKGTPQQPTIQLVVCQCKINEPMAAPFLIIDASIGAGWRGNVHVGATLAARSTTGAAGDSEQIGGRSKFVHYLPDIQPLDVSAGQATGPQVSVSPTLDHTERMVSVVGLPFHGSFPPWWHQSVNIPKHGQLVQQPFSVGVRPTCVPVGPSPRRPTGFHMSATLAAMAAATPPSQHVDARRRSHGGNCVIDRHGMPVLARRIYALDAQTVIGGPFQGAQRHVVIDGEPFIFRHDQNKIRTSSGSRVL